MTAPVPHTSTRIKICGITNVNDATNAIALGVDAIGLVFYASSPRAVSIVQAREIAQVVGPFVTVVGLFVDASANQVNEVLQHVSLHLLQFHGDESAEFCKQFHRPWIKALRMKAGIDLPKAVDPFKAANGILLDSYKAGVPGGTGETFNWSDVPKNLSLPVVLAGGLNADNVREAIQRVHPYAVDVSGGVESEPGKKDFKKMQTFVDRVRLTQ